MRPVFAAIGMIGAIPAYYARDVRTGDGLNSPFEAAVEVRA